MPENDHQNFTIGYIPINNQSEYISCGDPESSETMEVYLKIANDEISLEGKNFAAFQKGMKYKFQFWKVVATEAQKLLTEGDPILNPVCLEGCFRIFRGEIKNWPGLIQVAWPEDCGEFKNDDGHFSGYFYVRYELFSGGEYYNEQVIVFK